MNALDVAEGIYVDQSWGDVLGRRRLGRANENAFSLSVRRPRRSALIVEDDVSIAHLAGVALRGAGHFSRVDWATSVEEAMGYLQRQAVNGKSWCYDLIFIDVYLDGRETGVDLWKYLNKESLQNVPVVMTSSMLEKSFSEILGHYPIMPKFLKKPFQMGTCIEAISEAMNKFN